MRHATCEECGGKCCKFFVIPANKINKPDIERYFAMRKPIAHFMVSKRMGRIYVINAPCEKLTPEGKCSIYSTRPMICRKMDANTLSQFCVPAGCKYDVEGELGEDFLE